MLLDSTLGNRTTSAAAFGSSASLNGFAPSTEEPSVEKTMQNSGVGGSGNALPKTKGHMRKRSANARAKKTKKRAEDVAGRLEARQEKLRDHAARRLRWKALW